MKLFSDRLISLISSLRKLISRKMSFRTSSLGSTLHPRGEVSFVLKGSKFSWIHSIVNLEQSQQSQRLQYSLCFSSIQRKLFCQIWFCWFLKRLTSMQKNIFTERAILYQSLTSPFFSSVSTHMPFYSVTKCSIFKMSFLPRWTIFAPSMIQIQQKVSAKIAKFGNTGSLVYAYPEGQNVLIALLVLDKCHFDCT